MYTAQNNLQIFHKNNKKNRASKRTPTHFFIFQINYFRTRNRMHCGVLSCVVFQHDRCWWVWKFKSKCDIRQSSNFHFLEYQGKFYISTIRAKLFYIVDFANFCWKVEIRKSSMKRRMRWASRLSRLRSNLSSKSHFVTHSIFDEWPQQIPRALRWPAKHGIKSNNEWCSEIMC